MNGMSDMLSMFSGVVKEIETEYKTKKDSLLKLKGEYKKEIDKNVKNKLRQDMNLYKKDMLKAKDKMISLLKGVSNATLDAMKSLDNNRV